MNRSLKVIVSPPAKTIYVYVNGIKTSGPKKVLLNAMKLKNWYRMLEEITKAIEYYCVVKRIFTAEDGYPINNFEEMQNNGSYVVSDSRDYIKLENGYVDQRCKVKYINLYSNCALWLKNLKKNLTHVRPDLVTIYVFKNNEPDLDAKKFVFTQKDLKDWKKSLDHIARTLDFPKETIQFLYTTDGERICGSWELQHGASYVAVEYLDKFVSASYKEEISTSCNKWKFGVPYQYKPKFEHCFHTEPNIYKNSWKCNINWKHFNQRYSDFFEDSGTYCKNTPCRPMCDCKAISYYDNKQTGPEMVYSYRGTYMKLQDKDAIDSDDDMSVDSLKVSYI